MRRIPTPRRRLINMRDLVLVMGLPFTFLLAWCLPERLWAGLSKRAYSIRRALYGRNPHLVTAVRDTLGGRVLHANAISVSDHYAANYQLDRLYLLRQYRRSSVYKNVRLIGGEHIERAIQMGNGAILWIAPFVFSDLMAKIALHANGYAPAHLSHPTHGFSDSTFGVRVLNPLRTNVESRYLAERIVIGAGGPAAAALELSRRLKNNRIVSISAINRRTDDTKTVPFFDGATTLPCGPCRLSIAMSAPLLPVVTVRDVSGEFVTTVENPLLVNAGNSEPGIERAIQGFAEILERRVTQYPAQYRWHEVIGEPSNSIA
jgi:lauroyl/myristoyl acyltransferase